MKIACSACGAPVARIPDVGNPWLDAGIVPFSTLHYREDPDYWATWFPADFITESFPGQFRNWFYSMLAMSTVLRREPPFRTIFGYATLFGEDGRPMHKSWGNAIEFDEAAERMGVDVMRWMYAKARPDDNILFGWHAADEARRELLVLWNVYAFFVTYARLAGWTPARSRGAASPSARRSTAGSCPARRGLAARGRGPPRRLRRLGAAAGSIARFVDDLSTWYLRLSRRRFSPERRRGAIVRPRSRRSTRRSSASPGSLAPILPFLAEAMYQQPRRPARRRRRAAATASTCTALAGGRARRPSRPGPRGGDGDAQRAVELARTLRSQAGLRTRQPLARLWLALPGGELAERRGAPRRSSPTRSTSRTVELIDDESELVERRVKPLLPRIGKRLGPAIPAVMAAARDGRVRDPRRRLGRARRRRARPRRGRDPGGAAAGHGRRPRRRPRRRHRHRADAGAAGRGRRARAPAGDPGSAPRRRPRARRPDRSRDRLRGACRRRPVAPRRPWPRRRSPTAWPRARCRTAGHRRQSCWRPRRRPSPSAGAATGQPDEPGRRPGGRRGRDRGAPRVDDVAALGGLRVPGGRDRRRSTSSARPG